MVDADYVKADLLRSEPKASAESYLNKSPELSSEVYRLYRSEILPELEKINISILSAKDLDEDDKN
jgi:hypothetical protein